MNKKDIIKKIAENTGVTQKDATIIVDEFLSVIVENVQTDKVSIAGFGTFEVVERASRIGRNPQTSKEIFIPEHKVVKFKPAKNFKDSVNINRKDR